MARPFLFFDVGGTLLHLRPSLARAMAASMRELGCDVSDDGAARAVELALDWAAGGPHATDLGRNRRWWFEVYGYVLGELGLSGRAAEIGEELWRRHRAGDWLLPADDAAPTLEALGAAGYRMAVISNWDDTLPAVLGRRGLLRHFEFVLASAEVGVAKPDREIFLRALRLAGVAPADAFHVGDDPVTDVAGASEAGIRAVYIGPEPPGGPPKGAHASIAALAELPALVSRV